MTPAGLPHSVIRGSRDVCSSPRLFAAYHDLLRQTAPRHPPWTRIRLTIFSLHPFLKALSPRFSALLPISAVLRISGTSPRPGDGLSPINRRHRKTLKEVSSSHNRSRRLRVPSPISIHVKELFPNRFRDLNRQFRKAKLGVQRLGRAVRIEGPHFAPAVPQNSLAKPNCISKRPSGAWIWA